MTMISYLSCVVVYLYVAIVCHLIHIICPLFLFNITIIHIITKQRLGISWRQVCIVKGSSASELYVLSMHVIFSSFVTYLMVTTFSLPFDIIDTSDFHYLVVCDAHDQCYGCLWASSYGFLHYRALNWDRNGSMHMVKDSKHCGVCSYRSWGMISLEIEETQEGMI